MTQLSLIEKPKELKVDVLTKERHIVKTITNSDLMWGKINSWLEDCKNQKENFAYFVVDYRANVHLDSSKDEFLTTSTTMERPFKDFNDSFGGCWGCGGSYGKDNLDKLKEELVGWRKGYLEVPYCREKADGTALRDIKAENVRIFIDDKGKEFIAREANWNLNDLSSELKAIKETPLTEEYLKKFDRMEFLDKEINKIDYDVLPGLKNKAEKAFDDNAATQTVLDGEKFDLNAAQSLFRRLKMKLTQMQKEYDELRHELYRW